jgi:hypothetical protein
VLLGAFGIPALQWGGLNALCQLVLVSNALVLVAELWVSARLVKCRVSELLSAALPPVLAGTLTIGATFMLYHRFANRDSLLVALAAVLFAVLAYVASILVTNKHILSDARALFRPARAATVPALPPDDQP